MALIDKVEDNDEVIRLVELNHIEKPKYMNGVRVIFRRNPKEIHERIITITQVWSREHREFSNSKKIRVISKFKYSPTDPWWSGLENERGEYIFVLDESIDFFSIRHMYSPKTITR